MAFSNLENIFKEGGSKVVCDCADLTSGTIGTTEFFLERDKVDHVCRSLSQ